MIATIVLVVVFAVAIVLVVRSQGAYYRQVGQLATGGFDGKTVKVGGTVLSGSVDHTAAGYRFIIKDLTGADATVKVMYAGQVPDAFGPGVDVVAVGVYHAGDGLIAADELQTKCPSKYKVSGSPSP
jgi:cytochrome c-type biogenesis protein CcmE